jgi:hypothetical protein
MCMSRQYCRQRRGRHEFEQLGVEGNRVSVTVSNPNAHLRIGIYEEKSDLEGRS